MMIHQSKVRSLLVQACITSVVLLLKCIVQRIPHFVQMVLMVQSKTKDSETQINKSEGTNLARTLIEKRDIRIDGSFEIDTYCHLFILGYCNTRKIK